MDVDRFGAAVYTYPVLAIDGVGGVKPNIAALYNSQASNGILGKGGSISGLSVIKRCQQTLVRDGQNKALTWGTEDRFCIDTQRLMLVAGTQGAADSQYRTEIDNGVLYTAKGGTPGNPDYFEAKADDGATLVFGGSNDAKESGGATMTWALSQYQDSVKNTIQYIYEGAAADGLRIKRINYAFLLPATIVNPGAYIEFEYKDREDPISKYVAGYEFRNNKLLSKINTYGLAGLLYRSYQFDVATSSGLAGYVSRWQSVKECTTLTVCADATQFEWGRTQKNVTTNVIETKNIKIDYLGKITGGGKAAQLKTVNTYCCTTQSADLNSNGVAEFFWIQENTNSSYGYIGSFDGASLANDSPKYTSGVPYSNFNNTVGVPSLEFADINADGFLDILNPGSDTDYASRRLWGIESIKRASHTWLIDYYAHKQLSVIRNNFVRALDLDGDGFQEILGVDHRSVDFSLYKFDSINSKLLDTADYRGRSYDPLSLHLSDIPNANGIYIEYRDDLIAFGDFNSDGKKDLILLIKHGVPAVNKQTAKINWYEQQGTQLVFKETIYEESRAPLETYVDEKGEHRLLEFISFKSIKVVDINGDGLDDVVFQKYGIWMYAINTGNGFLPFVAIPNNPNAYPVITAAFIDVNNDGKADYIYGESTPTATFGYTNPAIYVRYWNSKIAAFDAPVLIRTTPDAPVLFADMNGDGFVDVVENHKVDADRTKDAINVYGFTNNIGNATVGFQGVLDQDTIVSVKTGLATNALIDYQTLIRPKQIDVLSCTSSIAGVTPCYDFSASSQYKPLKIDVPHKTNSLDAAIVESVVSGSSYYYTKTNEPFLGLNNPYSGSARVSQYVAPLPIVTRVKNNFVVNSDKKYFYEVMRTQAGGRGLLGFEKTSIQDVTSGSRIDVLWRLDWPYTGKPSAEYSFNSSSELLTSKDYIYKVDTAVAKQFNVTSKSFESFYNAGVLVNTNTFINGILVPSQSSSSVSSASSSVSSVVSYPMLSLVSPLLSETYKLEDGNEYAIIAKTYSANSILYKNMDGTNPKILYYINGVLQTGLRTDLIEPTRYWKPTTAGDYLVETQTTLENGTNLKSRTGTFHITQDGAPSISLNSPAIDSTVKLGSPIFIGASASDTDGTIDFIRYYVNGNLIGITSGNNLARITWMAETTGEANIYAVATDSSGKNTTTASRRVLVITTSSSASSQSSSTPTTPYIELSAPLVYSPELIGLGAETPLFAYVLNPSGGVWLDNDYHEAKIDFYANGNIITNARKDPKGPMLWWKPTETGSYGIKAVANLGGGKKIESKVGSVTVVATGMPTVTLTEPLKNGFIKLGDSLTLSASASDPDSNLSWVRFYANEVQVAGNQFDKPPYTVIWKPAALGDYTIRASAMDATYIKSTSGSITISVVDPGTKPAVTIISPDDGSTIPFGESLNIYANAVDFDGSISKIEFFANDQLVGTSTVLPYRVGFTPKVSGIYELKAVVYDNLGNTTSSGIHAIQYGLTAPKISFIDGDDYDCFLGVNFNASKNANPNLVYDLFVRPVGQDWPITPVAKKSGLNGEIPPYKMYFNDHASGEFEYRSRVCPADNQLACSVYSKPVSINIPSDCKAKILPTVSLVNPPSKIKVGEIVTLNAQASITSQFVSNVRFYYGEQEIGVVYKAPYTINWTPTAEDHNYLYAQAEATTEGTAVSQFVIVDVTNTNSSASSSSSSSRSATTSSSGATISAASTSSTASQQAKISLLSPIVNKVSKENLGSSLPLLATVYDQELRPWKNADGKAPRVEYYINEQLATNLRQDSSGPVAYWKPASIGNYSIKAVAYLDNGKTLTTTTGVFQITEPALPTINVKIPAGVQPFSVGSSLELQANVGDPDQQIAEVRFFANGNPIAVANYRAPYVTPWIPTEANTYKIEAELIDKLGHRVRSSAITVMVSDAPNPGFNGVVSASNFGDAIAKGLKWIPVNNTDMLIAQKPNFFGISYSNLSNFLVKEPLKIINRPDLYGVGNFQAAKLIVIDAAQIQLNSSIEIVGAPADLLLISSSKTNTMSCNQCSFKNIGRVTLAVASPVVTGYMLTVGDLKTVAGGQIQITNADAGGVASLELLADRVTASGIINTQLYTKGSNTLELTDTKISGESKVLGSGGVSILDGALTINYEKLEVSEAGASTGTHTIAANIFSGAINITSTNDLDIGGIFSTKSDLLAAQVYRGKLSAQPETINIKTFQSPVNAVNPGTIFVKGQLLSDNEINLFSSGGIMVPKASAQIDARCVRLVAKADVVNQGAISAKRLLKQNGVSEESSQIRIEANSIDNRGNLIAEDLYQQANLTQLNSVVAGEIMLSAKGDIKNRFGGNIRAKNVVLFAEQGAIRNGSLYAFDDTAKEAQTFKSEPHSTTRISTLSDLPVIQGKPRINASAAIVATDITLSAKTAIENINPYTEPSQASATAGALTSVVSQEAQKHMSDVKIEALHTLRLKTSEYVLNSSAVLGVSSNSQSQSLLQIDSPVIRNERYYLNPIAEMVDEYNQVIIKTADSVSVTTTSLKGIQSRLVFYSPPGLIYSMAPAEFNFGDSNQIANKGLLNNVGFIDLYSDARFIGAGNVSSLGLLLEKQAFAASTTQATTMNECIKYSYNVSLSEYEQRQICRQNYFRQETESGAIVNAQLENTLFGVMGRLWAFNAQFTGSNHLLLGDLQSKIIADFIAAEEANKSVNYSQYANPDLWRTVIRARVSADGKYIVTTTSFVAKNAASIATPPADLLSQKDIRDLYAAKAAEMKIQLDQTNASYQSAWGVTQ